MEPLRGLLTNGSTTIPCKVAAGSLVGSPLGHHGEPVADVLSFRLFAGPFVQTFSQRGRTGRRAAQRGFIMAVTGTASSSSGNGDNHL